MVHYQFTFDTAIPEEQEVLIALLDEIGFEGFEQEEQALKAFIPQDHFSQISFDQLIQNNPVKYSKSIVEEINWNQKWETDFEPVTVDIEGISEPFAFVRAAFHQPMPGVKYDIIITPKMSFGTGHHATTYLMMEQMAQMDFQHKSVLDFGTGTGVLAILAEKMGAATVTAIDHDEWSIRNAEENIIANQCSRISILQASAIESGMQADIILANINLNVIKDNLPALKLACKENTKILFSGILSDDENKICTALTEQHFIIDKVLQRNNWLALVVHV